MTIEQERLVSIIEFAQHSARLSSKLVAVVTQHDSFVFFEDKAQGRPALHFNQIEETSGREVWLTVERLHETPPPDCCSEILRPWLELSQGPDETPSLRASVPDSQVLETARSGGKSTPAQLTDRASRSVVMLVDYARKEDVKVSLEAYLESRWKPWADDEKQRREVIKLYAKLFTLRQQLQGGLIETPTELVWGVGIGIWNWDGLVIQYPLLTQTVEVSLNQITAAIEITPRDVEPRLETDWYASVDNPGLASLEGKAKEFFATCTTTFSPFDRGTFEPLLRAAVTYLDPNGLFWPDRTWAGDRALPTADKKLRVTDTWVLFARPRMNNAFVRDLENFKSKLSEQNDEVCLPPAVQKLVSEPSSSNPEVRFPEFRGISASDGHTKSDVNTADLYFPKPFNDEQVRILQLLEISDGVVVQGPQFSSHSRCSTSALALTTKLDSAQIVRAGEKRSLELLRDNMRDVETIARHLLESRSLTRDVLNIRPKDAHKLERILWR